MHARTFVSMGQILIKSATQWSKSNQSMVLKTTPRAYEFQPNWSRSFPPKLFTSVKHVDNKMGNWESGRWQLKVPSGA